MTTDPVPERPGDPTAGPDRPADPDGPVPLPVEAGSQLPPRRLLRGARRLVHLRGHQLLVGITVRDATGEAVRREQFCGTVLEVSDGVVVVERGEGEPAILPADEEAYEEAPPGTYHLSGSGEVVTNPDFLTTWEVRERPEN
jgi:hypothetical protein